MDLTNLKQSNIKTRVFPEHNYKALHINGKTIRIALDDKKPIDELLYPEFYDVAVTPRCSGACKYCYQNSIETTKHTRNILQKFKNFFEPLNDNQRPFQIAFGGGEPTSHPKFLELIKLSYDLGITPNYTTNGMWVKYSNYQQKKLLNVTKQYCGGVAVSTHSHLKEYWQKSVDLYLENDIFTNLHVIIGNKKSIDDFIEIYKKYTGNVRYFVLLPLSEHGRSTDSFKPENWDYFKSQIEGSPADIAFGANFYPYLQKDKNRFNVSLYPPEIMSAYLDLNTMKIFKSSFSNEQKIVGK